MASAVACKLQVYYNGLRLTTACARAIGAPDILPRPFPLTYFRCGTSSNLHARVDLTEKTGACRASNW
jgi:hypothetical protein